jgi:hypothetical protein
LSTFLLGRKQIPADWTPATNVNLGLSAEVEDLNMEGKDRCEVG